MSDLTSIQSMMPSDLIGSEIQDQITGLFKIDHSDLQKYEVIGSVRLNKYPKYDAFLFDRVGDIRQNNWTMKYRCSDLQKFEVTRSVKLNKYPKNDAYLLDRERARDIRQNHWTM